MSFGYFSGPFVFGFLPHLGHAEVPRPGIKPTPWQRPEAQQWQCRILNQLSHMGTPHLGFFGHPRAYGVPRPGIRSEPHLWPMLQVQQCWILWPTVPGWGLKLHPGATRHCRPHCATAGTPLFVFVWWACQNPEIQTINKFLPINYVFLRWFQLWFSYLCWQIQIFLLLLCVVFMVRKSFSIQRSNKCTRHIFQQKNVHQS